MVSRESSLYDSNHELIDVKEGVKDVSNSEDQRQLTGSPIKVASVKLRSMTPVSLFCPNAYPMGNWTLSKRYLLSPSCLRGIRARGALSIGLGCSYNVLSRSLYKRSNVTTNSRH